LLSLFFKNNERLAITLPPNSHRDWESYNRWKTFTRSHDLNIIFEASSSFNFIDLVKSAKCFITTSITEGFGFAFLEPWTAGQPLAGRRLPDICADFEKNGLGMDHLYSGLFIPLDQIDKDSFFRKWSTCIQKNLCKFHLSTAESSLENAFNDLTKNNRIDFGILDEETQQHIISSVLDDSGLKKRLTEFNPVLNDVTHFPNIDQRIAKNNATVLKIYNQANYRNQLLAIYRKVLNRSVRHRIDKQRLAYEFINPETFSLLKWSEADV